MHLAGWWKPAAVVIAAGAGAALGATLATAHDGATTPKVVGSPTAGKAPFKSTCGGCHTLMAAGTKGTQGPDLDSVSLPEATIVKAITAGGASVMTKAQVAKYPAKMPAYGGNLPKTEIQNIAAFVYSSVSASKMVKVSLTTTKVMLSPKKVQAGKITFAVHNGSSAARKFSIDGKSTPQIQPGKSASLAATFKKAGSYPYSSIGSGTAKTIKGVLIVSKPPATPTTSTPTSSTPTTTSPGMGTTTTTPAPPPGGGGLNENDAACPPGKNIITNGLADADGDEAGTEPNDGDGCL